MLKKLIYLLPFFVVVSAVAAPSTGLLNKNKSNIGVAKTVAITPKGQTTVKANPARVAQSNLKAVSSDDSARLPALSKLKQPNKIPVANQNTGTNTNTNTTPATTGVSQSAFDSLTQRVEALESKNTNAITDVVESGSGTYVNGVTKENNKLNVEKTHLLYAPVKNANGATLSGNAEIWIVK